MENFAKKIPIKTYVAFAFFIFFQSPEYKILPKQTIDHDPPKLSSTQLYFWYHQNCLHETG
jgi:hypothetical protein